MDQFKDHFSGMEAMHIMWMIALFHRAGIHVREFDQTSVLND